MISPLLDWYHQHKRDLPWRKTQDPYKIWISEIMLQQTQVATVIDYYNRFLKKFPAISSLAEAKEEEVLSLWSGLGYYSRARNLHQAAKKIVEEHQGKFPQDPKAIQALPGIGRYTLGAIASIAFHQPLPVVDGNVIRVYARLFALKGVPNDPKFQKKIWAIAEKMISPSPRPSPTRGEGEIKKIPSPGDFNQALMELGATICTPKNPLCLICPVAKRCRVRAQGPENFPEKKKNPQTKILKRVALLLQKNNQVLLTLSDENRWMKKLWQIPSLFAEKGESPEDLLKKLALKWGLDFQKAKPLKPHTHSITHHRITVFPYTIQYNEEPLKEEIDKKWFKFNKLEGLALPAADRKILSFSH